MLIDTNTGELFLYGEVFYGCYEGCFDDVMIIEALSKIKDKKVIARINSPGGLVDMGVAIKNALQRHPGGCDVIVDGVAASIASWIMLAGETITFSSGTRAMLHSPLTGGFGWMNAKALREVADVLDIHEKSMLGEYAKVMEISEDEVKAILDAETWFTAEEATDAFSTATLDTKASAKPIKIAAGVFKNTPKELIDASLKARSFGSTMHLSSIVAGAPLVAKMEPKQKQDEPASSLTRAEQKHAAFEERMKLLKNP